MQQKLFFLLGMFLILCSCSNRKDECYLYGKLKNADGHNLLFLVEYESNKVIDTIHVSDGEFYLALEITKPQYFIIRNERNTYPFRDRKEIWLEPSEIKIEGDFEFLNNVKVTGSASNDEFIQYSKFISAANNNINKLNTQIMLNGNDGVSIGIRDSLRAMRNETIIDNLSQKNHSYVTLYYLFLECFNLNMNLSKYEISKVFEKLDKSLKETKQGNAIAEYLKLPPVPGIGDQSLDISLPNPDGDTIRLSDYRGKYVLLDFWASWCSPCRSSNKELVKIYNKYHSKGFEILSVSGDTDKECWLNSIESDSIRWENVSDLKGWHNRAFLLYDVKYIPRNMLIGPDGTILGNNYCNFNVLDKDLEVHLLF